MFSFLFKLRGKGAGVQFPIQAARKGEDVQFPFQAPRGGGGRC